MKDPLRHIFWISAYKVAYFINNAIKVNRTSSNSHQSKIQSILSKNQYLEQNKFNDLALKCNPIRGAGITNTLEETLAMSNATEEDDINIPIDKFFSNNF